VELRGDIPQPTYCYIPTGSGALFNVVNQSIVQVANLTAIVGPGGIGVSVPENISVTIATYPSSDVDTVPQSALYVVQHIPNVGVKYAQINAAATTWSTMALKSTSSGLLHSFGGGGTNYDATMATEPGIYSIAARATDANGQSAYCNGALKQDLTLSTFYAATTTSTIYRYLGANNLPFYLLAFWRDKDLGKLMLAELSANPWQIFKPRKRILYFDVSSFPVLSSLTAGYITSSGGRLTAST